MASQKANNHRTVDISNSLIALFDNDRRAELLDLSDSRANWSRVWPFIALHLACFAVIWVGVSYWAVAIAIVSYVIRMFAITAFYHRYFAHKSFKTSRFIQGVFAFLGTAATQRGPLWWAGHHRHHHRYSDTEQDLHSPRQGFWQSHCGWFLGNDAFVTPRGLIKDFSRYPELVWMDRYDMLIPVIYALALFGLGEAIAAWVPESGTNGWQVLIWGYFVSTVVLIHATLSINSLSHRFGSKRYETRDDSRNNWLLALITLGEGWHNNHHHYAGSARQGFFWWEIDISYYLLRAMESVGLVWDLRPVPEAKKYAHRLEAKRKESTT